MVSRNFAEPDNLASGNRPPALEDCAGIDWDAISAVSQLIGSIAVVVSVLYLAVQFAQQHRVARVAAMDAAAAALRDVTKPFMENAAIARGLFTDKT
jgi:hypothetical protein